MKKILDWITYMLNLVVAVPVIAVVFFMVMALNAYLAAAVCVALFAFWAYTSSKTSNPKRGISCEKS